MSGLRVLVVTGGPLPWATGRLPEADMVIAADRGADNAIALGLTVDLLVGDLDSVSEETLAACHTVVQHPIDKDVTDLELALAAAVDAGAGVARASVYPDHRCGYGVAQLRCKRSRCRRRSCSRSDVGSWLECRRKHCQHDSTAGSVAAPARWAVG